MIKVNRKMENNNNKIVSVYHLFALSLEYLLCFSFKFLLSSCWCK